MKKIKELSFPPPNKRVRKLKSNEKNQMHRRFLNSPAEGGVAFVAVSNDGSQLDIGDCSRKVTLDLSCWPARILLADRKTHDRLKEQAALLRDFMRRRAKLQLLLDAIRVADDRMLVEYNKYSEFINTRKDKE